MHISLSMALAPFKKLIVSLGDTARMVLFGRAYELSTLHSQYRDLVLAEPDQISEGLAVKVIWQNYFNRRRLVTPMISVTAINDAKIERVTLLVEGYASAFTYQSTATAYNLGNRRVLVALPSLPFRYIKFREDHVEAPYTRIRVSVLEMTMGGGQIVNCAGLSPLHITPMDNLERQWGDEQGNIEIWGDVFNLDFIRHLLIREKINLIGSRYSGRFHWIREKLFSNMFMVKMVFWSRNLVLGRQVNRELTKFLASVMPMQEA